MKRAVICVPNPHDYIDQLSDYSIMILNPTASQSRNQYLLDHADWSLKIDQQGVHYRDGADYENERLFWYTSGTTGDSKFCSFSQQQLDLMVSRVTQVYDITANDRFVNVMPLWHAHGQAWYWIAKHAKFEINHLSIQNVRSIEKFSPTFISAIPDLIKLFVGYKFDHLRFMRSASASMPATLYTNLKEQFKVPIIEAFGMTETLSQCFTNPLHGPQKIGTVGLPDGVQARIVEGRLEVQGPTVCVPGWFDTGDLAEQDEHGYFKILGRSIEQINIKGYKINPISIEQQVRKLLPALESVIIFGSSECNCVYVGSVDITQVSRALKQIHPVCFPKFIKQVEEIPKPDSGKISRIWLQKYFECK